MILKKTFIIAEVGQAHDGSLGMLHAYIDAVATTGVDAIKFQTHIAAAESSAAECFRVNFSLQDKNRYDYWQRMSFTENQWSEIKTHCQACNLEFMSTPFSVAAVDLLEKLDIQRYKIGSGDIANYLLLDKVAATGKPLLLSTGMSDYQEVAATLKHLHRARERITLMQCTTRYPTPLTDVGLNNLQEYKTRFATEVGLSDHSGTIYPAAIAPLMGAVVVENHVVFDKRLFGPDVSSSLTIEELKQLVDFIRSTEILVNQKTVKDTSIVFHSLKNTFGRSLSVNKDLTAGHVLHIDDFESKKPAGQGVDIKQYQQMIGKKLNKDIRKYAFLQYEDVE